MEHDNGNNVWQKERDDGSFDSLLLRVDGSWELARIVGGWVRDVEGITRDRAVQVLTDFGCLRELLVLERDAARDEFDCAYAIMRQWEVKLDAADKALKTCDSFDETE